MPVPNPPVSPNDEVFVTFKRDGEYLGEKGATIFQGIVKEICFHPIRLIYRIKIAGDNRTIWIDDTAFNNILNGSIFFSTNKNTAKSIFKQFIDEEFPNI